MQTKLPAHRSAYLRQWRVCKVVAATAVLGATALYSMHWRGVYRNDVLLDAVDNLESIDRAFNNPLHPLSPQEPEFAHFLAQSKRYQKVLREYALDAGADPLLLARGHYRTGSILAAARRWQQAEPPLRSAVAILDDDQHWDTWAEEPEQRVRHFLLGNCLNCLGVVLRGAGRLEEARMLVERAVAILSASAEVEPLDSHVATSLASAWDNSGQLFAITNRPAKAQSAFEKARAIVVQAAKGQPAAAYLWELAAVASENRAGELVRLNQVSQAKDELHMAIAARDRLAETDELHDFAAKQLSAMQHRWSNLLGRDQATRHAGNLQ
jgi:tetratricopeptide (TPR) repeat protein